MMNLTRLVRRVTFTAASIVLSAGALGQSGRLEFLWGAFGPAEPSISTAAVPQIQHGKVKVLYDWRIGKYPYIWQGQLINGGVPVAADIQGHVTKMQSDIAQQIPDPNWDGYAVIDYEAWELYWDDTNETHKALTRQIVRTQYPDATDAQIETFAKRDHELAAKNFLQITLETAKAARPNAKWGFYGYPRNFHLEHADELGWLWNATGALYPSAYTVYPVHDSLFNIPAWWASPNYYPELMTQLVAGARQLMGTKPVVPFVWCRYHDMNPLFGRQFLRDIDLRRMLREPRLKGADALIFWEYFATQSEVSDYASYFTSTLRAAVADADAEFNPPPVSQNQGSGSSGHSEDDDERVADAGNSSSSGSGGSGSGGSSGSNNSSSSGGSGSSGSGSNSSASNNSSNSSNTFGGQNTSGGIGGTGNNSASGQSNTVATHTNAPQQNGEGSSTTPPPPPGLEAQNTSLASDTQETAPTPMTPAQAKKAKKAKAKSSLALARERARAKAAGLASSKPMKMKDRDVATFRAKKLEQMRRQREADGTALADAPTGSD